MKYDHVVNHNGTYYQAGEEVPETNDKKVESNDNPLSSQSLEHTNDYQDSDIMLESKPTHYTKEDLDDMTVKHIKQIAEEMGIVLTKTIRDEVIEEFLAKQQ